MMRYLALVFLVTSCRGVFVNDPPDPPDFTILVEPDPVLVTLNTQQRTRIAFLVRVVNHGPGMLFMPDCGHEIQRRASTGQWVRVHFVVCRTSGPPFAVDAGEAFGYGVNITAPPDSVPWRQGSITGSYRSINHISSEFRAGGAWGRPVALGLRTSPEFVIRE